MADHSAFSGNVHNGGLRGVLTRPEGKTPTESLPFIDLSPDEIAKLLTVGSTFRVKEHGLPRDCVVRQAVVINRPIGPKGCRKGSQIVRMYLEPEDGPYAYWLPPATGRKDLRPVTIEEVVGE